MAGDLMSLFQSGNPFLIDEAYNQLGQATQKNAADIAQVQALTNKTNTMLPYDIEHSKALTGSAKAQARTQNLDSDVKESIPLEERSRLYWAKHRSEATADQLKQLENNMEAMRVYALKPSYSLEDQMTMQKNYPGLLEQLSQPNGRKIALKAYDDYVKSSRQFQIAKYGADSKLEGVLNKPTGGAGKPDPGEISVESINRNLAKTKGARNQLAYLKSALPQLSEKDPQAAEKFREIYTSIKTQAEAELAAGQAGKVDIGAATKGRVPVNPPTNLDGQQAAPKQQYSQQDLEFTAKKYNISVDEVKKRLGIK